MVEAALPSEAVEARPMRVDLPVRGGAGRVRARQWRVSVLLLLSDFAMLSLCTYAAVVVRWWIEDVYELSLYFKMWPLLLLFPAVYACQRLYPSLPLSPATELRQLTVATSLVWLGLGTLTFLLREGTTFSRSVVLASWLLSLGAVPLGRAVLRMLLANRPWWGYPVVVLGSRSFAARTVRSLRRRPEVGLKPVAVLDLRAMERRAANAGGAPLDQGGTVESVVRAFERPVCVVAMSEMGGALPARAMNRLSRSFPQLIVVPEVAEIASLGVGAVDLGGTLGLEVHNRLMHRGRRALKRALDLTLVLAGLPVVLPLLGAIALAVRLDSPGPVVYRQPRIGWGGRRFTMLKFRSMHRDADARLAELLAGDPELREQWHRWQKLPRDPRVTRVGAWLRRTSLDELPQLFNVLSGEMSLVGPRPLLDDGPALYGEDYELFKMVRPGITGLWQVSGRNHVSFAGRVEMDAYYVRNWSVFLDLYLLSRTVLAVLLQRGAM